MLKSRRFPSLSFLVLLWLLVVLLSACSGSPVAVNPSWTPPAPGNPPGNVVTAQQMPRTETSCPAPGTARAAVIRPLHLGTQRTLVYVYNEVPQNTSTMFGHLRLYNVTTGKKTDLISSAFRIDQAQVSADGQWVLFLNVPDPRGDSTHSAYLQLIRVDGQGLQTLYCFPNGLLNGSGSSSPDAHLPLSVQWSADQRSIVFGELKGFPGHVYSFITRLDLSSGLTSLLFMDNDDPFYSYSPVTWLDTTSIYIRKDSQNGSQSPSTVYLLNAYTATPATNPQEVLTSPAHTSNFSFDSSYDSSKLFSSSCSQAANPFDSTVSVSPVTGGTLQQIYHESPNDCIENLRAVTPGLLLLQVKVADTSGFSEQLWTLHTDGTGQHVLTSLATDPAAAPDFSLNQTTQFPWSNVSRDNEVYAVWANYPTPAPGHQSILIGSLNGGSATSIATTDPGSSTLSVAGWTTL